MEGVSVWLGEVTAGRWGVGLGRLQEVHSFGILWVTVRTLASNPMETRKPLESFDHKRHDWAAGLRRDYEEQGEQDREARGRGSCKLQPETAVAQVGEELWSWGCVG